MMMPLGMSKACQEFMQLQLTAEGELKTACYAGLSSDLMNLWNIACRRGPTFRLAWLRSASSLVLPMLACAAAYLRTLSLCPDSVLICFISLCSRIFTMSDRAQQQQKLLLPPNHVLRQHDVLECAWRTTARLPAQQRCCTISQTCGHPPYRTLGMLGTVIGLLI